MTKEPRTRAEIVKHASKVRWDKERALLASEPEKVKELRSKRALKGWETRKKMALVPKPKYERLPQY